MIVTAAKIFSTLEEKISNSYSLESQNAAHHNFIMVLNGRNEN